MEDNSVPQTMGDIMQMLVQQQIQFQAQLQEQISGYNARMDAITSKPLAARKAEPPKYNGGLDEDLELWIFCIEQYYADYYPLMTEESAAFTTMVSCHFGPSVMNWYRRFSMECDRNGVVKSWPHTTDNLRQTYLPPDLEYMLREQLHNLEQLGTLHEYIASFQDILVRCRVPISPLELRFYFQSGLRFETAVHLREHQATSLEESIEVALRYDHPTVAVTSVADWVKSATCHRCKKVGHLASKCPKK